MGRLVLAVVVGFVIWSAVWFAAGQVIMSTMPDYFHPETQATSSSGILLLFLLVSVVTSLVAGWATALLARSAANRAASILAGILLAVGLTVEITGWSLAPAWYHIVFLVLLVPVTLAGARLRPAAGR